MGGKGYVIVAGNGEKTEADCKGKLTLGRWRGQSKFLLVAGSPCGKLPQAARKANSRAKKEAKL